MLHKTFRSESFLDRDGLDTRDPYAYCQAKLRGFITPATTPSAPKASTVAEVHARGKRVENGKKAAKAPTTKTKSKTKREQHREKTSYYDALVATVGKRAASFFTVNERMTRKGREVTMMFKPAVLKTGYGKTPDAAYNQAKRDMRSALIGVAKELQVAIEGFGKK